MLKESKLLNEINNLQMELDQKTNALVTAENEIVLSKEALQEILSQKFNPSEAKKYLSSMKSSTELKSAKQMCEEYKQKLNESVKSNRQCSGEDYLLLILLICIITSIISKHTFC